MKYMLIKNIRNILKIFFIFPIKKNQILFIAYNGKQYSCNPKYIYEYILTQNQIGTKLIWAFNDVENYELAEGTVKVKYKSIKYIYYALTSKIIVENSEGWSILPIRNEQIVINTWHGGGAYKKVGIDRKDATKHNIKNLEHKNKRVNIYLSSSEIFTNKTLRESFKYTGKVLNSGMPRNDILVNQEVNRIKRIKESIGISDERILLIAPTFRAKSMVDMSELDYEKIANTLNKRFGGKWIILYRSHYYANDKKIKSSKNIMDVSKYSDMQELLLISDILITDYSSSMWDFSLMFKPVFLYSSDLEDYTQKEREFYTPLDSWPFTYASSENELLYNIENHDEKTYKFAVKKHHDDLGSYEQGIASNKIGNKILKIVRKED